MIKFHHKRLVDQAHGTPSGKGGATFAFEEVGNNKFVFTIARCHEKDNFNKAQGRVKAAGRLNSPRYIHTFNGTRDQLIQHFEQTPINMIGNL